MSMSPLKVVFHLDGTGVFYDPHEPPMLDGLLSAACVRHHFSGEPPARDEDCPDVPLPLSRWRMGELWGWKASALFPDGAQFDGIQFWRKRFRQNRVELTEGSPDLCSGIFRDWNMPLPLLIVPRLVAYAHGDAREVKRELKRNIFWIGKKRSHGRGRVVGVDVERIDADHSLIRDGKAMRWLPSNEGIRLIRLRPPYWNIVGRVRCCEIGDAIENFPPRCGG